MQLSETGTGRAQAGTTKSSPTALGETERAGEDGSGTSSGRVMGDVELSSRCVVTAKARSGGGVENWRPSPWASQY
jgi:hypothetical protein